MPLSKLQSEILRLLAAHRDPESYVAGRREPRDIVDLVLIHRDILPLGAVIWAAAEKALGSTPEGLINEIRRLAHYTESDFARVDSDPPVDPVGVMTGLSRLLKNPLPRRDRIGFSALSDRSRRRRANARHGSAERHPFQLRPA